jgi:hypothetical protein
MKSGLKEALFDTTKKETIALLICFKQNLKQNK